MEIKTFEFLPAAQERINALSIQIASLEAQRQQFIDGVIVGMEIDVHNSDISVDIGSMTVSVGPKGAGFPIAPVEETQD